MRYRNRGDPLAAERFELLQMIDELGRLNGETQGEVARTLARKRRLRGLRRRIMAARSSSTLAKAWKDALPILAVVAAEIARICVEVLNCLPAAFSRMESYEGWREHQIIAPSRWLAAA